MNVQGKSTLADLALTTKRELEVTLQTEKDAELAEVNGAFNALTCMMKEQGIVMAIGFKSAIRDAITSKYVPLHLADKIAVPKYEPEGKKRGPVFVEMARDGHVRFVVDVMHDNASGVNADVAVKSLLKLHFGSRTGKDGGNARGLPMTDAPPTLQSFYQSITDVVGGKILSVTLHEGDFHTRTKIVFEIVDDDLAKTLPGVVSERAADFYVTSSDKPGVRQPPTAGDLCEVVASSGSGISSVNSVPATTTNPFVGVQTPQQEESLTSLAKALKR